MSKKEHIRMIAAIICITISFSIAGLIQGLEILTFILLSSLGLYLSFSFIKYVYKQKDYSLGEFEDNINE
jgi:hypothetical protein